MNIWEVVFFKQIKYNFKFQHTGAKDGKAVLSLEKMYFSELIIFYKFQILRIIEAHNDRLKNNKDTSTHFCKINNAKLVNGISYSMSELLWNILKCNTTQTYKRLGLISYLSSFSNIYVTYVKNKKDRSYQKRMTSV